MTIVAQEVNSDSLVIKLAAELEKLSDVLGKQFAEQSLAGQLPEYTRRLRNQANEASTQAWSAIQSLEDWQRFRDEKLNLLRQSLGWPTAPPVPLMSEVTRRYDDPSGRFIIENIVYQSRPKVWITANLYRPAKSVMSAPGILISHAHHTPKEHAELQAMGMTWAQAGCYVLVPDHFGHGERRQHPFVSAESFPGSFRVSRQDYYFRYDLGMKLHWLGESLMSWLAWDLSRGVDCLLAQPGIDPKRIILLGSVAGGGDPCAVTAALDDRITAAVPFNFGGPQPETAYPLPEDAETSFNYVGSGSWESTRNLTGSASDGFLPWAIVGGIAPRRLIYAHEFRWDREHDPVWQRLRSIYQFYNQMERLDFTHGRGELRGQPPEASHCTHIGAFHRQRMHEAFRRWFQIDVSANDEILEPLPIESLQCLTKSSDRSAKPTEVDFESLARERIATKRMALSNQSITERRSQLQTLWSQVLASEGRARPFSASVVTVRSESTATSIDAHNLLLRAEDGIQVPLVLLLPQQVDATTKQPLVLIVQTVGMTKVLKNQSRDLARLLAAGQAVCLADLRGTGASSSGTGRGRTSAATSLSSSLLMQGDPLLAGQLRDLRAVWSWLRAQPGVDSDRIQVWGDSRRPTLTMETDRVVPRDDDASVPSSADPAAGLLALLLTLYADSAHSLCVTGTLSNFSSALKPQQIRLPHDCVLPGIFRAADMEELIVQAAERLPVRCECLVDGRNMPMSQKDLDEYRSNLNRLCPNGNDLKLTTSIDCQAIDWLLSPGGR